MNNATLTPSTFRNEQHISVTHWAEIAVAWTEIAVAWTQIDTKWTEIAVA